MKSKGIQIKDLVSIGVYTAIYFVGVAIAALLCVFIVPGYSYIYIPIVTALLSGVVFMLMAAKVPKFGAITIMGSIMGLFFFVSGRFPLALIPSVLISLIADGVAYLFKYRSKKGLLLSYTIFSFSTMGPVLPMIFMPEYYAQDLLQRGKSMEYVLSAFESITNSTVIILFIGTIIAALIGGLFGQRMMKKHFEKAGIV